MKKSKVEKIKVVVSAVSGIGVGMVVSNIIKYTLPPKTKLAAKICIGVGGTILTSLISKKCEDHVDYLLEDLIDEETPVNEELIPGEEPKDE